MAVRCLQVQVVDAPERADLLQRSRAEGRLALEGVEDDPFQKIPQRHVERIGECLEDLGDPLFHADAVCTRTTERRSGTEELRVGLEEFLRVAVAAAGHAASYPLQVPQRQVALVLARDSIGGREAQQRMAEAGHGVVGMTRQVQERDPQVLAVAEALLGEGGGIEGGAKARRQSCGAPGPVVLAEHRPVKDTNVW